MAVANVEDGDGAVIPGRRGQCAEMIEMRVMFCPIDELEGAGPITDAQIDTVVKAFRARLRRLKKLYKGYAFLGHGPVYDDKKGY